MASSEERRNVARMLRWFASLHGNVAYVTVERTLNLDYSDGFGGGAVTSESVRRLADLIDPTCEVADCGHQDGHAVCRGCLSCHGGWHEDVYDQPYAYCPRCGCRLVNGACNYCGAMVVSGNE